LHLGRISAQQPGRARAEHQPILEPKAFNNDQ
jgi:hypothetical protein